MQWMWRLCQIKLNYYWMTNCARNLFFAFFLIFLTWHLHIQNTIVRGHIGIRINGICRRKPSVCVQTYYGIRTRISTAIISVKHQNNSLSALLFGLFNWSILVVVQCALFFMLHMLVSIFWRFLFFLIFFCFSVKIENTWIFQWHHNDFSYFHMWCLIIY